MKFQILTLFPEFFHSFLQTSLIAKAIQKSLIEVDLIDIKKFSQKGRADDYPIGGGDSMILSYPCLKKAVQSLKTRGHVLYPSPQGQLWNSQKAKDFSKKYSVVTFICGRYGGIDHRFIQDFVKEELSIGDYILNGGETAVQVFIESCSRFLKAFMKNKDSYETDSFENSLLKSPQWTKPFFIEGHQLPEVLLSGHHEKIKELREYSSLWLTYLKKPELLKAQPELLKRLPQALKYLTELKTEELKALGLKKTKDQLELLL